MRRRPWLLIAGLTAALALVGAVPASAYQFEGKKWPSHVITYYNGAKASSAAVAAAVYAWNTSGASVRFVPAPKSQADLVIANSSSPGLSDGGLLGLASAGYYPHSFSAHNPLGTGVIHGAHMWLVPPSGDHGLHAFQRAQVAAHEFGHVLGLGHESRGCAMMNPALNSRCPPPHPWQANCRTLQRDDVSGAIALYGGRLRAAMPTKFCDLLPKPGTPTRVSATLLDPRAGTVSLTWTNPGGISLPQQFTSEDLRGRPDIEQYAVYASLGSCPQTTTGHKAQAVGPAGPLQRVSAVAQLGPGRWCVSIFAQDAFLRAGRPAHVWVDVPTTVTPTTPTPTTPAQTGTINPSGQPKVY